MFTGLYVALVTPFKDGKLNEAKLRELVRFHIKNGTDGLVPCGTTGENPTFTQEEYVRIIEIVCEEAKGKLKIIAGAGTNNTEKSIANAIKAKELGADGVLIITPYYNKPTQEGLIAHFTEVAKRAKIPIVMYNVPGRTGVNLLPETVEKLTKVDYIVGLKEASGNIEQISDIIRRVGDKITVLSGDDGITLPILSIGGKGVISVVGNLLPADMKAMLTAYEKRERETAIAYHYRLFPVCKAMFIETNPAPIKEAMNLCGFDVGPVRLPLVGLRPENREKLKSVLINYGLEVKA